MTNNTTAVPFVNESGHKTRALHVPYCAVHRVVFVPGVLPAATPRPQQQHLYSLHLFFAHGATKEAGLVVLSHPADAAQDVLAGRQNKT